MMNRIPSIVALAWLLMQSYCGTQSPEKDDVMLYINEFMTSNTTTGIVDENGEADDWIELYNGEEREIRLLNFFCSDDSTDLRKYALPDTTIAAHGYLLIWADDAPDEGVLHAPFKLSAERGEEIILSNDNDRIVDRIPFFPHNNNPIARVPGKSYGRNSDGDSVWVQQFTPSPGEKNGGGRR